MEKMFRIKIKERIIGWSSAPSVKDILRGTTLYNHCILKLQALRKQSKLRNHLLHLRVEMVSVPANRSCQHYYEQQRGRMPVTMKPLFCKQIQEINGSMQITDNIKYLGTHIAQCVRLRVLQYYNDSLIRSSVSEFAITNA